MESSGLNIQLVKDTKTNQYIGYCIATIDSTGTGEIDSLYIKESYRGLSIGDHLMENGMKWFNEKTANPIIIGVAGGNEKVLSFYERYGFYPKVTILEKTED